jgi:hypothetical protein
MPRFMTFVCPELDTPYEAVYQELASYLEIDVEEAARRFLPDDAVARVRYFRRQRNRQHVQQDLAEALGVDPAAVFAACSEDGARILLDALRAKEQAKGWEIAVTPAAEPPALIDEIEDMICR